VIVRWCALGGALLLLSGCATRPPVPQRTLPAVPPAAPTASENTLTPRLYLAVAANVSLMAVRASQFAATRASDERLRETAQRIASDQGGVGAQLNYAGRRLNLLPDAALPLPMAAELEQLGRSENFDRDYRRLATRILSRGWQAHANYARLGTSPTLRMVARFAEPVTSRNIVLLGQEAGR
jgi:putative membrane protein